MNGTRGEWQRRPDGTITVLIRDDAGNPEPGQAVEIRSRGAAGVVASGITGSHGQLTVRPQRPGRISRTPGRTEARVINRSRAVAEVATAPALQAEVEHRQRSLVGSRNFDAGGGLSAEGTDWNPDQKPACGICFNLPDNCLPRGWQLASPNTDVLEKISLKGKELAQKKTKANVSATDPTTALAEWKKEYRAFRKWSQSALDAWLDAYEQWSSAPNCLNCKHHVELMEAFKADCCAVWTPPPDGPQTANDLLLPPQEIWSGWSPEDWFPSIMTCDAQAYKSHNSGLGPTAIEGGPVLPVVLAVRRDTPARRALLATIYQKRAWRSLPHVAERRFWARLFGDELSCESMCLSKLGSQYSALGTNLWKPAAGIVSCGPPPIPYAFGLPPIEYALQQSAPPTKAPSMEQFYPSPGMTSAGSPNVPYSEIDLYVSVWPVAVKILNANAGGRVGPQYGAIVRSGSEQSSLKAGECRLLVPTGLVSPGGSQVANWTNLAVVEGTKWTPCPSASCPWP
ncbi:MAG: hypothetical protein RIT45_2950 [Pseudomonadota bacterium]|jgi:hypothetical protein